MYAVTVRDHVMIAHSFRGEIFGPAQRLHGATYVIDVEYRRAALDADGLVVDIGLASKLVREVLSDFDYRNLDEVSEFTGKNTTTEFMAREIHDRISARTLAGALGPGGPGLDALKITLHESHIAWASYEGPLR